MKDSSAYMIRLDLLRLAQTIELERTMTLRIQKENDWNARREWAQINKTPAPPFPDRGGECRAVSCNIYA